MNGSISLTSADPIAAGVTPHRWTILATRASSTLRDVRFAAPVGLALRIWVAAQLLHGTVPRLLGDVRHEWLSGQLVRDWMGPLVKDHAYFSEATGAFLRFVLHHSVGFAWILLVAELMIGLGVITGTLLRPAALGGLCLMILYTMAGFSGVSGEFAGAFLGILLLGPNAGLIGGDGVARYIHKRTGRGPSDDGLIPRAETDRVPT